MESDTKNIKRGRPAVVSQVFRAVFYDMQGRALTNMYYVSVAQEILNEAWGRERFVECFVKETGKFKRHSIMVEIGRMYLQNGYRKKDCVEIAETALLLLERKWTVKQVAAWIRRGRMYNDWS